MCVTEDMCFDLWKEINSKIGNRNYYTACRFLIILFHLIHVFIVLSRIFLYILQATNIEKETLKRKWILLYGPLNKDIGIRLAKCYGWSVIMNGAEIWSKKDERMIEAREMWI